MPGLWAITRQASRTFPYFCSPASNVAWVSGGTSSRSTTLTGGMRFPFLRLCAAGAGREPLSPHGLADGFDHAVHRRQGRILQDVGLGERDVGGGDPHDRVLQVEERLLRDERGDLGPPPEQPRVLLHGEQPIGLANRLQDGGHVEWD